MDYKNNDWDWVYDEEAWWIDQDNDLKDFEDVFTEYHVNAQTKVLTDDYSWILDDIIMQVDYEELNDLTVECNLSMYRMYTSKLV